MISRWDISENTLKSLIYDASRRTGKSIDGVQEFFRKGLNRIIWKMEKEFAVHSHPELVTEYTFRRLKDFTEARGYDKITLDSIGGVLVLIGWKRKKIVGEL